MIAAAAITKQYLTMFFSHLSRMRSGAARSEQTSAALLPLGSIAISSVAQRWRDRLQSNARRRLEDTKYGVEIPRFALHPVRPSVLGPHVACTGAMSAAAYSGISTRSSVFATFQK